MDYVVSRNGEIIEREEEDSKKIDLPPGFRFHPTDEELITHYLRPKVLNTFFSALTICEVDLNKVEPWDLPWKAKIGEKEWYFFCVKERKYPTGLRTNRATKSGYWKATGKDKEIFKEKSFVGMKKTLVFYKGRAPRGVKTNWVMHEYRLEGKYMVDNLPKAAKNEWVISRVFQKGPGGTKANISGLMKFGSRVNKFEPVGLRPLMDSSPYLKTRGRDSLAGTAIGGSLSHVTCFSDYKIEGNHLVSDSKDDFNLTMLGSSSNLLIPNINSLLDSNPLFLQENASILKMLLDNEGTKFKKNQNSSTYLSGLSGPVNLDGHWKF